MYPGLAIACGDALILEIEPSSSGTQAKLFGTVSMPSSNIRSHFYYITAIRTLQQLWWMMDKSSQRVRYWPLWNAV